MPDSMFDEWDDDNIEKPFDAFKEWEDMPEFVQQQQKPYKEVIVRFASEDDYKDFQSIMNQKLTMKTPYIWHPAPDKKMKSGLRFVDGK